MNAQKIATTFVAAVLAIASDLATIRVPSAQSYPSRPMTVVVPYPAGGPTDILARILTERMKASLGQPFVVENVSGAMGSIGVGRVARAAPDGYLLSIGDWNSHVSAGAILPVEYDVLKDLEPVAQLTIARLWLVGRIGLPARNTTELISWVRRNQSTATAAIPGAGSAAHLCAISFLEKIGAHLQFVPYRGGAPAYQDLVAGHVDLMCTDMSTTLPLQRDGRIKAYAALGRTRTSLAPEIPTMGEVGLGELDIAFWRGLWVPKGTPKQTIAKLNSAVVEALADATVRRRIGELNQEISARELQTPEGFGALHRAEIEKWWPIIKAANIKTE